MVSEESYGKRACVVNRKQLCIVVIMVAVLGHLLHDTLSHPSIVGTLASESSAAYMFTSSARACPKVDVNPQNLRAQSGEDRHFLQWFGALCDGTYLEMGALDGLTYSNTYVLHKELGWRGVLIELSPKSYAKLIMNRPGEIATINAAVCDERRSLHFVEGRSAVNGIWEFAPESFRSSWWSGLTLESPEVHPVECAPLSDLLKPHVGDFFFFDVFSLDVEGAEFEVVKSIDFSKIGFGIILVEADGHNQMKNMLVRMHLEDNGYSFIQEHLRSYWFVNKAFSQIYGDKLRVPQTAATTSTQQG